MANDIEELRQRVSDLEGEIKEVWHMLSQLQDAMGAEDFSAAYDALSHYHPEPPPD